MQWEVEICGGRFSCKIKSLLITVKVIGFDNLNRVNAVEVFLDDTQFVWSVAYKRCYVVLTKLCVHVFTDDHNNVVFSWYTWNVVIASTDVCWGGLCYYWCSLFVAMVKMKAI